MQAEIDNERRERKAERETMQAEINALRAKVDSYRTLLRRNKIDPETGQHTTAL